MPKTLMITTCGTSPLTNLARNDENLATIIKESANAVEKTASAEQKKAIAAVAERFHEKLAQGTIADIRKASAELNGLLGFYNNQLENAHADVHFLLHTDTLQGETVAEVLREYLAGKKVNASVQSFRDLRTDKLENFQSGLAGVINWCQENLPGYRAAQYRIVFNLTGGFKSIQGWMQTLGMFYADEIIYIFESGGELLRIPRVPVNVDKAAIDVIDKHLPLFRRLGRPGETCRHADVRGIPETFFYQCGQEYELSPWGKVTWIQAKDALYSEKLLDSPVDAIRFTDRFKEAAGGRSRDEWAHINERIDDFAAYLADERKNPDRLNVRPLRGNPKPPSTHEFNAWAKSPGWRFFFHDQNGVKILDNLAEGLH
jgi:putative CRISPR-associated protein (TIGR02619 family)